ncbi:hypothetical protein PIB30_065546 [Stylosanthes scabra]|uniref:Uncharacterized protein n=1 Tax=Stylosanthes scabra TaxID=79078 RepID=A0ABU6UP95_9FABA|nr:hypothetical protein [Stylosanthes scabra]
MSRLMLSGVWEMAPKSTYGKIIGFLAWESSYNEQTRKIIVMAPPSPGKDDDTIAWNKSHDGSFSLKTAYNFLVQDYETHDQVFKLIWHWKGHSALDLSCGWHLKKLS